MEIQIRNGLPSEVPLAEIHNILSLNCTAKMYGIGIRLNISFLIVSVILLLTLSQTRASYDPSSYLCSICITAVDDLRQNADKLNLHTIQHGSNTITGNLLDACALRFPMESCKLFFPDGSRPIAINDHDNKLKSSRSLCSELDLCPIEGSWREVISKSSIDASEYDIRVSKALGSRGYDKVSLHEYIHELLSYLIK